MSGQLHAWLRVSMDRQKILLMYMIIGAARYITVSFKMSLTAGRLNQL